MSAKPQRLQTAHKRLRQRRQARLSRGLEQSITEATVRHNVAYELYVDGEFVRRYWGPGPHSLPAICTEENRDRWEMRCEGVVDEGRVQHLGDLLEPDRVIHNKTEDTHRFSYIDPEEIDAF